MPQSRRARHGGARGTSGPARGGARDRRGDEAREVGSVEESRRSRESSTSTARARTASRPGPAFSRSYRSSTATRAARRGPRPRSSAPRGSSSRSANGFCSTSTRRTPRLVQARESLDALRQSVMPEASETVQISELAYRDGEQSYLFVLDATRRLSDARLAEAEALANLRRANARLERGLGRKYVVQP